jgi:hypothetical protein
VSPRAGSYWSKDEGETSTWPSGRGIAAELVVRDESAFRSPRVPDRQSFNLKSKI